MFGKQRLSLPSQKQFDLPRAPRIALGATWRAVIASGGRPDPESASREGFEFTYQQGKSSFLNTTTRFLVRAQERPDGTTRIAVSKQGGPPLTTGQFFLFGLPAAASRELSKAAPARSIFVSYRRSDSADVTGRILDRLRTRFGADAVFRDVDDIRPGDDFRRAVHAALKDAKVVVPIIGPQWVGAPANRLDEREDMVRVELESAFACSVPIIPVLVSGADVPARATLPRSLHSLRDLNFIHVRPDPDFERDIDRLSETLSPLIQEQT